MFARKAKEKTPRELFNTIGVNLITLIKQGDLNHIKTFMSGVTETPSDILHLCDENYRSIISIILDQQNPEMSAYFYSLILSEYKIKCAQALTVLLSGLDDKSLNLAPTDNEGYYLYHWALILNQIPESWLAIIYEFNPNPKTKEKHGSFYYALDLVCQHGSVAGLQFLLDELGGINGIHGQYKDDLILQSVRKNHLSIIKLFINAGVKLAGPRPSRHLSDLALTEAARLGRADIVAYLLNEYSDQAIHTNEVVEYALNVALSANHFAVFQLLLPRWDGEISSLIKNVTFNERGFAHDNNDCLRFLLEHGADANADSYDDSLLKRAISARNLEAVKLLLGKGATPALSGLGSSMYYRRHPVDIEIVNIVMSAMGNPAPEQLQEAVNHALSVQDLPMLAMLLQRGVTLSGSALKRAIGSDKSELFSALMTDYANYFSSEDIKDAAISALESGYIDMFTVLYSRLNSINVNDFAPYISIPEQKNLGFMKDLASKSRLNAWAPPDHDEEFASFLVEKEVKVKVEHQQCLEFLLSKGLDPNVLLKGGKTLLAKAVKANNIDMCRILLLAGANPNLPQAVLPLIIAVKQHNVDLIALLLEHGAEMGEALSVAQKHRYADIASMLKAHFKLSDMHLGKNVSETNHYYIRCGVLMFSAVGGGTLNYSFSMLVKEPVLLDKLPHGFTANCSFAVLKDIIPKLKMYESLPEGVVDMGDDNEHEKEMGFDFYYDCEGLDKETVLKAIAVLKEKYLLEDIGFDSNSASNGAQEDRASKRMFDPVTVITNTLLNLINPKPSVAVVNGPFLMFQSEQYDSDDSYPDSEPMLDAEFAVSSDAESSSSDEREPSRKKLRF